MPDFAIEFQEFLAHAKQDTFGMSRKHFRFEKLYAYLRIGPRIIHHDPHEHSICLQIANLNIEAEHQYKGTFSRFLAEIERLCDLPIFIEGVLNRKFGDALIRRGFVVLTDYSGLSRDLVRRR